MKGASLCLSACSSKDDKPRNRVVSKKIDQRYNDFIDRWDKDQDGLATCKDIILIRATVFTQSDSNKDGNLTPSEFRDIMHFDKSFRFIPFEQIDKNASGLIEQNEFTRTENKIFKRYDKDNDCMISKPEFAQIAKEQVSKNKQRRRGKGKKSGHGKDRDHSYSN